MLQYAFLADFDEGQQQLCFTAFGIRHQQTKIEFYLAVDVADLMFVHFNRRIEFGQEFRNNLRCAAHYE